MQHLEHANLCSRTSVFTELLHANIPNMRTCFEHALEHANICSHEHILRTCRNVDFLVQTLPQKMRHESHLRLQILSHRRVRWTKRAGELHSSEYNWNTFWSSSRPVLPVLPRPPVSPVLSALWVRRGSQRMIVISGASQYLRFYKFAIKSLSELMCCIFGRLTVSAN